MAVCIEELGTRTEKCDKHGDFESTGRKTPFGVFWTPCKTCDNEEQAQREIEAKANLYREMIGMYEMANLPKRYQGVGFKNFTASSKSQKAALALAHKFHNDFPEVLKTGKFLIFNGKPGTGKTHLSCAVLRNLLHDGYSGLYVSAIDAIRMLRDSWRKGAESTELDVLKKLEHYDVLVIDEIGMQFSTDAERIQLFDILNRRYAQIRPTILVTNLTVEEMQSTLGERIFDRFREVATVVTFDWPSFRGKQA